MGEEWRESRIPSRENKEESYNGGRIKQAFWPASLQTGIKGRKDFGVLKENYCILITLSIRCQSESQIFSVLTRIQEFSLPYILSKKKKKKDNQILQTKQKAWKKVMVQTWDKLKLGIILSKEWHF